MMSKTRGQYIVAHGPKLPAFVSHFIGSQAHQVCHVCCFHATIAARYLKLKPHSPQSLTVYSLALRRQRLQILGIIWVLQGMALPTECLLVNSPQMTKAGMGVRQLGERGAHHYVQDRVFDLGHYGRSSWLQMLWRRRRNPFVSLTIASHRLLTTWSIT